MPMLTLGFAVPGEDAPTHTEDGQQIYYMTGAGVPVGDGDGDTETNTGVVPDAGPGFYGGWSGVLAGLPSWVIPAAVVGGLWLMSRSK